MQYVYEKYYGETKQENIVLEIEPCGDFIVNFPSAINTLVKDVYKIKCETSNKVNLDNINGKYLVCNDQKATLFEKTEVISKGYLYNSVTPEIKKLYVWKLLSYKLPIEKQEIIETHEEITLPMPIKKVNMQ